MTGAARACRLLGGLALAGLLAAAFTPAPNLVAAWLAVPSRVARADAVVALGAGGATWGDGLPADVSLRRALQAILLTRAGAAPLLVFTGTDAEIMTRVDLARRLGVPPGRIVGAFGSNTTRDEAALVRGLLAPRGVRRILLVTDSQHMIRAGRLFERAGLAVFPVDADDTSTLATLPEKRLVLARVVAGELLARLYYRIAGYL